VAARVTSQPLRSLVAGFFNSARARTREP